MDFGKQQHCSIPSALEKKGQQKTKTNQELCWLDEFLNFNNFSPLTDDANGSPYHKTYLNFSL